MSREHKKYKREQIAYDDKQQTKLGANGKLQPSQIQQAQAETHYLYVTQVMCAYCLYQAPLHKFLISTKKGFHKSQALCPECRNRQLIRTLTAEMTPEQYAEWMFENMVYGGWQKVPWTKWNERLTQLGWARPFWDKYKALKAEYVEEPTYEDKLNEEYKEWLKTHGE